VPDRHPAHPGNSGGPIFESPGPRGRDRDRGHPVGEQRQLWHQDRRGPGSLDQIGFHCQCWLFVAPKNVAIFLDGEAVGSGPKLVIPAQEGTHEVFAVVDGVMKKYALSWPTHRGVDFTK
ncbi:hypothetical protein G6O69_37675, partial [Pseudenhygromyxa sp. WMMC2535]|uniref:hypothetical protein n=1 Tax=Pseudenhygromyxa sp. WMMC2535 TaxID=2712867 RepID=UPI0015960297